MAKTDSPEYRDKKKFFSQLLTIYGRKPVQEALEVSGVQVYRLHLSESNKPAPILDSIITLAQQQGAEILYHTKEALSRISKNKKQDQGVAVDLKLNHFYDFEEYLKHPPKEFELIALDRVTNPQNLGMIIRSVCASPMSGILLPYNGCAKLDSLVIKASAGTLFRTTIIRCESLEKALQRLAQIEATIIGLAPNSKQTLSKLSKSGRKVFVLGNETEGMSPKVSSCCEQNVSIPMHRGVESLNVAVTAGIIAFRHA